MISVITRNAFQSRPLSFGLSHSLSLFGPGVKENGLFYRFNSDLGIVTIRVPYVTIIWNDSYVTWSMDRGIFGLATDQDYVILTKVGHLKINLG